jgi:hypothetical protein
MPSLPTVMAIGILLLLLLLLFVITFMHGFYNYVLANRPCIHSVAPLLGLQFIAHMLFRTLNALYFYISTIRIMCTVSNLTDFM